MTPIKETFVNDHMMLFVKFSIPPQQMSSTSVTGIMSYM